MTDNNKFEELSYVNVKSFDFCCRYIKEYCKYLFTYFFFAAPVYKWHTFLISSHRVSYDVTRAKMAIENEKDCFNKNALRSKFYKWGENRLKK